MNRSRGSGVRRLVGAGAAVLLPWMLTVQLLTRSGDPRADFSKDSRFSLSHRTELVAARISEPVTLYVLRSQPSGGPDRALLDQLDDLERVRVQYVDPDAQPGLFSRLGAQPGEAVLETASGRRTTAEQIFEDDLATALQRLSRPPGTVCAVTGHGERSVDNLLPGSASQFWDRLGRLGYQRKVVQLRTEGEISGCTLLVVLDPQQELLPNERDVLAKQAGKPGGILLFLEPGQELDASIRALLDGAGLQLDPGLVLNPTASLPGDPTTLIVDRYPTGSPVTRNLANTVFPGVGLLRNTRPGDAQAPTVAVVPPASSSRVTAPDASPTAVEADGVGLLALAERSSVGGTPGDTNLRRSRLGVVSDTDFLADGAFRLGANAALAANLVQWATSDEDLIALDPPREFDDILLTSSRRSLVLRLNVFLVPAAVLAVGLVVHFRRVWRRKPR